MFETGRRVAEANGWGAAPAWQAVTTLVSHEDIDRREVENVLRRLYPQHEEPTVAMFPGDAADLGLCRPSDRCDACRMATSRRAAPDGGSRPVIAARPLRTS